MRGSSNKSFNPYMSCQSYLGSTPPGQPLKQIRSDRHGVVYPKPTTWLIVFPQSVLFEEFSRESFLCDLKWLRRRMLKEHLHARSRGGTPPRNRSRIHRVRSAVHPQPPLFQRQEELVVSPTPSVPRPSGHVGQTTPTPSRSDTPSPTSLVQDQSRATPTAGGVIFSPPTQPIPPSAELQPLTRPSLSGQREP